MAVPWLLFNQRMKFVTHIFRVFVHIFPCRFVLVDNFDRIRDTDLFEGLIPELDSLLDPAAVAGQESYARCRNEWPRQVAKSSALGHASLNASD